MERAKEEILRVQVEAERLRAWMSESSARRQTFIQSLQETEYHYSLALHQQHLQQLLRDNVNLQYLNKLGRLEFSKKQRELYPVQEVTSAIPNRLNNAIEDADDVYGSDEEDEAGDLDGLVNFLEDEPYLPSIISFDT